MAEYCADTCELCDYTPRRGGRGNRKKGRKGDRRGRRGRRGRDRGRLWAMVVVSWLFGGYDMYIFV